MHTRTGATLQRKYPMEHPQRSNHHAARVLEQAICAHGDTQLRQLRQLYTEAALTYPGDDDEPRILRSWLDVVNQAVRMEVWHRGVVCRIEVMTDQAGGMWSPSAGLIETDAAQRAALRTLLESGVPGLCRILDPVQFRGEETWWTETGVAVQTAAGRAYLFDDAHMLCGERRAAPGQPEETRLYRDVRLIDGIRLPQTVELYHGPDHVATLTTLTMTVNAPLVPPAAIAGWAPLLPADSVPATLWRLPYASPWDDEDVTGDAAALLSALWRSARIIALGEATHGTHEFFTLKHQLIAMLAAERKDLVFAIEANMPEADRINAYVLEGRGDPRALIKGMHFWTWNTEEVLALIEWMRTYNQSGRGRMQFTGFDMQFPAAAIEHVLAFLVTHDPPLAAQAQAVYATLTADFFDRFRPSAITAEQRQRWTATLTAALEVVSQIEARRASAFQHHAPEAVARVLQYARLAAQSAGMGIGAPNHRDRCLADNVAWLAQQAPSATLVLWAHNIHVMRTPSRMGGMLTERFGDDYCPIGFTFYQGDYVAVRGDQGPVINTAAPALPSSSEARLHRSGHRRLIIDLQRAVTQPWGRWLLEKRPTRNIGAFAVDTHEAYALARLPDLYAALIFVAHSTPSQRLPSPSDARTVHDPMLEGER